MGAYDRGLPYMNPREVARGMYGHIYDEGEFMDNVTEFEAKAKFKKKAIERANAFMDGHRIMGGSGEGKMKLHLTNAEFVKRLSEDPDRLYTFIGDVDDPDSETSAANYKVAIKGINFDEVPIHQFKVGETIEIDVPFTFHDWEWL